MLSPGEQAPTFSLPGVEGGDLAEFSLSDHVGEDVVVLCFYRGDFNPQATEDGWLQDLDLLTLRRNVAVLAVGPDTAYSHRAFARHEHLDVPLLSDLGGRVAEAYGVLGADEAGHDRVPRRAVFVLDDRGVVAHAWAADEPDDVPDIEELRTAIESVKSDESAAERYRVAHDYYEYGRREFAIAHEAFESGEWTLAREAFREALGYLREASSELDAAHWFASTDPLVGPLRMGKERVDHYIRAAKWYCEAAGEFVDGDDELAAELRGDAERQHERAHDGDPLPEPDELAAFAAGEPVDSE